jgi:hypothetical protein
LAKERHSSNDSSEDETRPFEIILFITRFSNISRILNKT